MDREGRRDMNVISDTEHQRNDTAERPAGATHADLRASPTACVN